MYRRTTIAYRIAEAFFRNRRLFLLAFVLVSLVTMTALYMRSKTYNATALTEVVTDNVAQELGEQQEDGYISPAQTNVNKLSVLLNGSFLSTALTGVQLQHPINTDPQADDPRLAELRNKLSPNVESDDLFSINLTWDNADDAAKIVRAVQQQYIQEVGEDRYAQTTGALSFLDSQIASYEKSLRNAEQVLTNYKKKNFGELPDAQDANASELQSLQAQLENLETTADDATRRRTVLQQQLAEVKPLAIAEQTSSASPLQVQINALKAKRDTMLLDMLPTHPAVIAVTTQIQALEAQMQKKTVAGAPEAKSITQTKLEENPEWQNLHQQLVDATIEQQTQSEEIQKITGQIAEYQKIVQQIPNEQRELTDRTRDYKMIQDEYDTLLQKREQVAMEGNLARVTASSSLTPIGYIRSKATTSKTKMAMMFVGSLVLGLIVGLLLVVLCEWADHSLRYSVDVERQLGVPVLAVLPDSAHLRVIAIGDAEKSKGKGRSTRGLPPPAKPASEPEPEDGSPEDLASEEVLTNAPVLAGVGAEGEQS